MNCKDFERLSALNSRQELSPKLSAKLESHLASCGACRTFAGRMSTTRGIIRSWQEADPPEDLMAEVRWNVLSRIAEEDLAPSLRERWIRMFGFPGARIIGSAAAVAMILAAGWIIRVQLPSGNPPAPSETIPLAPGPAPALHSGGTEPAAVRVPEGPGIRAEAGGGVGFGRRASSRQVEPSRVVAVRTMPGHSEQAAPVLRRIELQTADPNIRIIWLFPEKAKSRAPEGPRGG